MSRKTIAAAALLILATGFLTLFITGGARFAIGLTLKHRLRIEAFQHADRIARPWIWQHDLPS